MKTLQIKLAAPLQSYGDEASFSRRTTALFPSKSAIIGMIAAAQGLHREDERISSLNQLAFAVRIDQPGTILSDFQTVEWKKDTRKITYRNYLQDAVFVVAIGSDNGDLITQIQYALHHPRFQLYLGRRSNPIAGVLHTKLTDGETPVEVLKTAHWQASADYQRRNKKSQQKSLEIIADSDLMKKSQQSTNLRTKMVKDYVDSFDQRHRAFSFREIATTTITVLNPYYEDKSDAEETKFDAFNY